MNLQLANPHIRHQHATDPLLWLPSFAGSHPSAIMIHYQLQRSTRTPRAPALCKPAPRISNRIESNRMIDPDAAPPCHSSPLPDSVRSTRDEQFNRGANNQVSCRFHFRLCRSPNQRRDPATPGSPGTPRPVSTIMMPSC